MAVPKALTAEQKRELVYAYLARPYGSKSQFLDEQGVSNDQLRRWRSQVFADTLELGLVPRGGSMVSVEQSGALARLIKQNEALQQRLQAQRAEHERALAAKDADLDRQRRTVDALGKAIEILHHAGAGKSSQPHRVEDEQP
jgi:transposase-like protein